MVLLIGGKSGFVKESDCWGMDLRDQNLKSGKTECVVRLPLSQFSNEARLPLNTSGYTSNPTDAKFKNGLFAVSADVFEFVFGHRSPFGGKTWWAIP
jgi:hypothetical protein